MDECVTALIHFALGRIVSRMKIIASCIDFMKDKLKLNNADRITAKHK